MLNICYILRLHIECECFNIKFTNNSQSIVNPTDHLFNHYLAFTTVVRVVEFSNGGTKLTIFLHKNQHS